MYKPNKKSNALEKTIFVFGVAILISLVGYLSYQWSTKISGSPSLEVEAFYDSSFELNTYEVIITNKGNETATAVNIEFDLYQNGKFAKSGVLEVDYIPKHSQEKGWVSFSNAKTPYDSLAIGSITFLKP